MKTFFYMGRNRQNVSGVSWKIWKIERRGRKVQTWWGRARLVNRNVLAGVKLATKSWTHRTEQRAIQDEADRIKEKQSSGYERRPRRK